MTTSTIKRSTQVAIRPKYSLLAEQLFAAFLEAAKGENHIPTT